MDMSHLHVRIVFHVKQLMFMFHTLCFFHVEVDIFTSEYLNA